MAFVVQEAAEKISTLSGSCSLWFTPCTMFGTPFPGAVSNTLLIPFPSRCLVNASLSLKAPVLSINKASFIPYAV